MFSVTLPDVALMEQIRRFPLEEYPNFAARATVCT
jgi:hypothetical protein